MSTQSRLQVDQVRPPPAGAAIYDPYDIWSIRALGAMKVAATRGGRIGFAVSGAAALADLAFPIRLRKMTGLAPKRYAHTYAMQVLADWAGVDRDDFLELAERTAIAAGNGIGWGYPFDWHTRNAPDGIYRADSAPFITVTPYVMEALLKLAQEDPQRSGRARGLFERTWGFLESLRPMYRRGSELALSYAPVDEQLLIINSNAYAAFGYALHAVHGEPAIRRLAREKAMKITRWVLAQQEPSGAWWYLAKARFNNFMDCFHTCFTIKNLLKTRRLLGDATGALDEATDRGWRFVQENFYDRRAGLCRRFLAKGTKDPLYSWDIYDQAEYLGLLVDFGQLDEAERHCRRATERFYDGTHWYCRIDVLGRRWGPDFLRWGIMPFLLNKARLEHALSQREGLRAAS